MYMPNASPNARRPNATYIPLTCVGGRVRSIGVCVGSPGFHVGSVMVFIYQDVGIAGTGNAKSSRWGCYPTRDPKAKELALL